MPRKTGSSRRCDLAPGIAGIGKATRLLGRPGISRGAWTSLSRGPHIRNRHRSRPRLTERAHDADEIGRESCTPCRGGIPPLSAQEAEEYRRQAPEWRLVDDATRIERTYRFRNFRDAFGFVEQAATLAEAEAITPISASAGATRPSRCARKRSRACTRTISSWRQNSTASPTLRHRPGEDLGEYSTQRT